MFTNKVKISVDNTTRLGAVATAFDGKASASGMMRLKTDKNGDQVLFCKKFSKTQFLAALGHKKSQETIRSQAKAAMEHLATMTDSQYGAGTAERIGLTTYGKKQADGTINVLAGRVVDDLNMHAKIDKAFQDLGLYGEGHSAQSRNAATQAVKVQVRQELAQATEPSVEKAVGKEVARADALLAVENKPVVDAMARLDLLTDASPAERLAALETIKGFADEAMQSHSTMPYSKATQIGAFRYAMQAFIEDLAQDPTFQFAPPRDIKAYSKLIADQIAQSKYFPAIDSGALKLAQRVFQEKGSVDPESMKGMQLREALQGPDADDVLTAAIQDELTGADAGTALRSNSAIVRAMTELAKPLLMDFATSFVQGFVTDELKKEVNTLDKNDAGYKARLSNLVLPRLNDRLDAADIETVPQQFCREIYLGIQAIETGSFSSELKADFKAAFFANVFALRILCPILATTTSEDSVADELSKAASAGLQKAVNSPSTNANYMAFMNKLVERGRLAA